MLWSSKTLPSADLDELLYSANTLAAANAVDALWQPGRCIGNRLDLEKGNWGARGTALMATFFSYLHPVKNEESSALSTKREGLHNLADFIALKLDKLIEKCKINAFWLISRQHLL
jgi:hypothetical protein